MSYLVHNGYFSFIEGKVNGFFQLGRSSSIKIGADLLFCYALLIA